MTLLEKVKANLILHHSADDDLLEMYITAATRYAESYQHHPENHYVEAVMPATTQQAIIMLSSHFYESRDGSTGGFTQIMFRLDSKYGIQSIFYCGLIGIGRCRYELWQNEYLYRYCRKRHH